MTDRPAIDWTNIADRIADARSLVEAMSMMAQSLTVSEAEPFMRVASLAIDELLQVRDLIVPVDIEEGGDA